jgi:hypothetical protein
MFTTTTFGWRRRFIDLDGFDVEININTKAFWSQKRGELIRIFAKAISCGSKLWSQSDASASA